MLAVLLLLVAEVVGGTLGGFPQPAKPAEAPTLLPPGLRATGAVEAEPMVITVTRTPAPQAAGGARVIEAEQLQRAPARTVDDLLRSDPGVGLFRRASSLSADPTALGLALRGVGPTGTSRALVLRDGVPEGDPFGGQVPWRALGTQGLSRIEIAPGAGSSLYGSAALGGVVQLVSAPLQDALEAGVQAGSGAAVGAQVRAARAGERGGVELQADALALQGWTPVAPSQRGPVDVAAGADHARAAVRAELQASEGLRLRARGELFGERQRGGTQYTTAELRRGTLALGAAFRDLDANLWFRASRFDQDRARLLPDPRTRTSEERAATQRVPAHEVGLGVQWTRLAPALLGFDNHLSVGVDARRDEGRTFEDLYAAGARTGTREAGGVQWLGGLYAQDVAARGRFQLQLAVRADGWRNLPGEAREPDGSVSTPAQGEGVFLSPRAALRFQPVPALWLSTSISRSFRAPTLNELYRPFQAGLVRTEANPALGAESLRSADVAADLTLPALALHGALFGSYLDDAIVNVTTGTNLQQRRNLGTARILGAELSGRVRLASFLSLDGGGQLARTRVQEAPGSPAVVGNELPQDPRLRLSAGADVDAPWGVTVRAQVRWTSAQFEDDRNQVELPAAAVVDLLVSAPLARGLSLRAWAENLLDAQVVSSRAGGIETDAPPRSVAVAVRWTQ